MRICRARTLRVQEIRVFSKMLYIEDTLECGKVVLPVGRYWVEIYDCQ